MSSKANLWHVGVSPWIIQDGNYEDFRVGQYTDFALEFYSEDGLQKTEGVRRRVGEHLDGSSYQIVAEVIHVSKQWWAIDCGVRCFEEATPPDGVEVGEWVTGAIYLGIDPFFYFEYLHRQPHAPALSYNWHVKGIVRELSPLIPDPLRTNTFVADRSQTRREPIVQTDAWHEAHDLMVHYILECQLLTGPRTPAPQMF